MKRVIICIALFLLFISNISQACWTDTGWITYTQPNGVKFTARMWGDEYESFFETKEGFSIEKNDSDGYYYYASNSYKGRFILTQLKVGIDKPVGIPKNLVRKNPFAARPQKITNEGNLTDNNRLSKVTVTNYTLKVLLVEFQDKFGRNYYTRSNFENMLDGNNYTTTPDEETAFGSMNQYYNSMTNGNVTIAATVLNNSGGEDIPTWIRLPYSKSTYVDNNRSLFTDAYNAGVAAGYNMTTNSTTKIVYIYAGNYQGGGLNPQANAINGTQYIMSEVWGGRGLYDEGPNATRANGYTFAHIGIHCHEFGHLIGLYDIYGYQHGVDWSLMGDGCDMGPIEPKKGQCPAPIDPHHRYLNNWITVQTPSIPNSGVNLIYDGSNPTIYRINTGGDVYYFENRRYQDYGSNCPDYASYSGSGGIIVWRTDGMASWPRVEIIEADGQQTWNGNYGDLWPGSSNNRNLNDFTTVNCKQYSTANSSIIMHSVSDPGTTMTAVLGGKWFGTLPSSLTFSGNERIGGNLTIPSGLTLTINAGSAFQIDPGASFIVNGTLNAVGNSSNNITFTRTGSSGTWGGINFQYNGTGTLRYCNISYATTGVQLSVNGEVSNCNISNNSSCGIFLPMSSAQISNNQIRNNGYYGIWAQNESSPSISGNIITGNSYSGIYADLYSVIGGNSPASNAIRNNGVGISLYDNSESYFGFSGSGGSNSICSSTGYEVSATSSSYAYVQGNWWGSYPPNASEFYVDGTSYIDRSSPLSSDPNPSMQKNSLVVVNTTELNASQSSTIDWDSFFDSEISEALQLFFAGNYQDALNNFEKKFNKETNIGKKKYVLAKISQCYSKTGKKGFVDYLNRNVRAKYSKDDELYAVALEMEYLSLLREGNFDSALENLNYIKDNYSVHEEIYKHSLFNLSLVYGRYLGDIGKAKGYITELEAKYPNDCLVLNSKILILGEDAGNIQDQDQFKITNNSSSNSEQYELQSYPNPFNPTTKISFSLKESGRISLTVFDVLGKELANLADGYFESGKHTATFDGSNLASGIYFCRLITPTATITKKMMLMK